MPCILVAVRTFKILRPNRANVILCFSGATSEVLLRDTVEEMKKKGPGLAKFLELSEYGHAPHLFSDAVVDPIVEFLNEN